MKTVEETKDWCLVHYDSEPPSDWLIEQIQTDARADLKSEVERLKAELAAMRHDLTESNRQRDEAQAECEEWKGKLIKSAFDVSKLKVDLREGNIPLESKLDQTVKERDEAQAAAAVMRDVVRDAQMHIEADNIDWARFQDGPDHDPNYKPEFPEIVQRLEASRSTTAGTAFLERMAEAEWLVGAVKDWEFMGAHSIEWCARRDAFLKGEGVKA